MNDAVQRYLKSVWPDYDQSIRIALERERIRVEIFDPAHDDAAYYTMSERSQGCKTFLSFLFTVGAEAKQGVIRNTVLLLDEPETRLHPSGVRHMLAELITAANNGNVVVFATHSVFMIDRKKFDRHVIVSKETERSELQPSVRGRVGFFMQEEVLYGALDVKLGSDFDSTRQNNFVFEGEGDVTLFESMYSLSDVVARKAPGFYQGGKCSDIKRYLVQRPIQLGSRWFFVLDNDSPARDLRSFLEKRYKDHIDKSIFIFHYSVQHVDEPEFEDLLPLSFVQEAMNVAACGSERTLGAIGAIEPGQRFADYFARIVDEARDEGLKERFKRELNKAIARATQQASTLTHLRESFPVYTEWGRGILEIAGKTLATN